MRDDLFLKSETAKRLYSLVRDLPIVDYHCHLPPKDIFEDREFTDIAAMWLGGDHYKWRLMRAAGVDERLVTGDADPREKFRAYAACVETAAGNPLYVWSHMELSQFFGIEDALSAESADAIFDRANAVIREKHLSPRKLMEMSRVELCATTDDPADPLEWHEKIAADGTLSVRVVPSFRTDNAVNLLAKGYPAYIERLGKAAGTEIRTLSDLKEALEKRLDFFCAHGCRISDVGIESFPKRDLRCDPAQTFRNALAGESVTEPEYRDFLFEMYVFLANAYRARGVTMQLHLGVKRNANSALFASAGPDVGGDCVGDMIPQRDVTALLDAMAQGGGLPKTILYTLEPAMYMALATAAGSFRDVVPGAAWWFCDHRRGMEEQLDILMETCHIGTFYGMLTDSRSFLSYARHDYFRRVFANRLARELDDGAFLSEKAAETLMRRVCVENARTIFK